MILTTRKRRAVARTAAYEKGYSNGHEEGFLAGRENARQLSLVKVSQSITTLDVRVSSLERLATMPRKNKL